MSHFKTVELVPWDVYFLLGENARNLVSQKVIDSADAIREWVGMPMLCNTPKQGGKDASGLRTINSQHYSQGSQHSGNHGHEDNKCCALDFTGEFSLDAVQYEIINNRDKYPHINFMEVGITWLHIDVRPDKKLRLWSPSQGFVGVSEYKYMLEKRLGIR